jgi:thiosulfate/3-mercaptopyruvate sulfurtransferase
MKLIRNYLLLFVFIITGCTMGSQEDEQGIIVSADWLQDQIDNPTYAILHVGTWEGFDSIHIPGARHIDPYEFVQSTDSLNNELPQMDTIVALLRAAGVGNDSRVVLYYENEGLISRTARVFVTLDYAGMGDRTSVLNGGLPGWIEEERETTHIHTDVMEGDLKPGDPQEVIIRAHQLDQQRWNPEYVIVDTRSTEEYYGEIDSTGIIATGGHLEGAQFLSYNSNLSESNPHMFKDDDQLKAQLEEVGMDPDKTAVYYCGSGIRASVSYLVSRHLGYPALLYDGSFQEWEELGLPLTSPVIDPSDDD